MTQRTEKLIGLKATVTIVALGALVARTVYPDLEIDAVALGLLILALLPWLSPLIKSAELPGGLKIEFQDIKEAVEKVGAGQPPALQPGRNEPTLIAIAEQDPNLAVVGLRIEIEKRLRALAEQHDISTRQPLSRLTTELADRGILEQQVASGLRDLIALGNQAAHGTPVSREAALSAADHAPRILHTLDTKLNQ